MQWENLREEEFNNAIERSGGLCVIPIGCLEMHGQHLPLGTDTKTCSYIANEAAKGAWRYYRELCTKENSFLPPDNFQELNSKGAAQRTSPTNIAMMLVGCVAAYRLGYAKLSAQ